MAADALMARQGVAAWTLGFAAALAGCTLERLDERQLHPGSPDGGASGGSGGGGASSGGASGASGNSSSRHCIYLGTAAEPGCETLVENPGFEMDVSGWQPESGTVRTEWQASDASEATESGSMAVKNTLLGADVGTTSSGARQCLPAIPGAQFQMAADVFIASGQDVFPLDAGEGGGSGGGVEGGRAALGIFFYDKGGCDGPSRMSFTSDLEDEVDTWKSVRGSAATPDGAASMAVRLLAVKPFRQLSLEVLFDNVLIQPTR